MNRSLGRLSSKGVLAITVYIGVLSSNSECSAFNIANGIFGQMPPADRVDDFVLALSSSPGFEARVAAGRATRLGMRSVIVTSDLVKSKAAQRLRKSENETWIRFERPKLQDMLPFEAYKQLGDSFKWMFVGEDDTLFFPSAARRMTEGLDPEQPHFLTDEAWFVVPDEGRHVSKAEAPQCVPCSYKKDMTLLPDHIHKACPYCNVSGPILPGFCGPEGHAKYGPHGGPGYLLSIGIFKTVTYSQMRKCLEAEKDIYLARCLWKMGIGATDPDPIWHPDRLTHFDPTPPPYLTHNSIMEKSSFAVGRLLRLKAGVCTGLCEEEVEHMVSLHVNAAQLGYSEWGDYRVGVFRDNGQREYAGQLVLRAISHFVHHLTIAKNTSQQLRKLGGIAQIDNAAKQSEQADLRISEALEIVKQWSGFLKGDARDVEKKHKLESRIVEAARARVTAKIARDALMSIQKVVTG